MLLKHDSLKRSAGKCAEFVGLKQKNKTKQTVYFFDLILNLNIQVCYMHAFVIEL